MAASRVFKIHPAIGVARLGNADRTTDEGFFIGPETPGLPANWDPAAQSFRAFKFKGRVKAQAARFRIWEYIADGIKLIPSREVTLDDPDIVEIEWTAHLANRKASFFKFDGRRGELDAYASLGSTDRRNSSVTVNRELLLDIDDGPQSIQGKHAPKVEIRNSKSHIPIDTLGELRTDAQGRLLVLGGQGQSNSSKTPPAPIGHYANNDTWFDDVSDGPVTATVRVRQAGGAVDTIEAVGAWVLVGPPDFAPPIGSVVTMYDTLWDVAVRQLVVPPENGLFDEYAPGRGLKRLRDMNTEWSATKTLTQYTPSFTQEIFPIFQHAFLTRWVHQPLVSQPGVPQHHDRISDARATDLAQLPGNIARRKSIFNRLRNPDNLNVSAQSMPKAFGDDYGSSPVAPTTYLSLTRVQHALLRQWMAGTFLADWTGVPPRPAAEDIRAEGLDRAALDNCVGGAFFPGIETSWLIRNPQIFAEPFRIRHGASIGTFTVQAGFFSQQMALPWQADFLACSKEPFEGDPTGTTFHAWWPAQRPDDVFRTAAGEMVPWARGLASFEDMVARWSTRGFVLEDGQSLLEKEGPA